MLGGHLPETENKRICVISGLKSGRGPLRNLSGGRLREFLKQYLTEKQNGCFRSGRLREVVAYKSGRYERVDCILIHWCACVVMCVSCAYHQIFFVRHMYRSSFRHHLE